MYAALCMPGWDNEIDIQKTIQLVRAQRSGMVQTEVCLSISYTLIVVRTLMVTLLMYAATVQVCVPVNSQLCGGSTGSDGSGESTAACVAYL